MKAHLRGTEVAVKRVLPDEDKSRHDSPYDGTSSLSGIPQDDYAVMATPAPAANNNMAVISKASSQGRLMSMKRSLSTKMGMGRVQPEVRHDVFPNDILCFLLLRYISQIDHALPSFTAAHPPPPNPPPPSPHPPTALYRYSTRWSKQF